jgi:hypothetical protein
LSLKTIEKAASKLYSPKRVVCGVFEARKWGTLAEDLHQSYGILV